MTKKKSKPVASTEPVSATDELREAVAGPRKEFICPFCNEWAAAFKNGTVVHATPSCQKFRELEPGPYLHEVNRKLGYHKKPSPKTN